MKTCRHPWTNHHSQIFMKGLLSKIFKFTKCPSNSYLQLKNTTQNQDTIHYICIDQCEAIKCHAYHKIQQFSVHVQEFCLKLIVVHRVLTPNLKYGYMLDHLEFLLKGSDKHCINSIRFFLSNLCKSF